MIAFVTSYWTVRIEQGTPEKLALESRIATFIDRLMPRLDFLREIQKTGGELELFVTLEHGDTIGYSCLRRLGDVHINLSTDF